VSGTCPTHLFQYIANLASFCVRYKGTDAGRVSTQYGTFLKGTELLDHVELGITNKDAKAMSVSTRKLIELSFTALLDSGIDYRSQNVGCYACAFIRLYVVINLD
jgi:hypothetical protein